MRANLHFKKKSAGGEWSTISPNPGPARNEALRAPTERLELSLCLKMIALARLVATVHNRASINSFLFSLQCFFKLNLTKLVIFLRLPMDFNTETTEVYCTVQVLRTK